MKRLPLFLSFIAAVILSASLAYWALQLFPQAQRPLAVAPVEAAPEVRVDDAAALFGGQVLAAAASNYQLKGVLAATHARDSVAILAVEGKPAQALPVGKEVAPGVTVKEVRPAYVLLSEGGVTKRLELAPGKTGGAAGVALPAQQAPIQPPPVQQPPVQPAPIQAPQVQPPSTQPPPRMSVAPTVTSPAPGAAR